MREASKKYSSISIKLVPKIIPITHSTNLSQRYYYIGGKKNIVRYKDSQKANKKISYDALLKPEAKPMGKNLIKKKRVVN